MHISMVGLLAAQTLLLAASTLPHPQGVLELRSRTFAAGDSLLVRGRNFEQDDAITLVLVGAAGRVEIGTLPTDSAGAVKGTVLVPATVRVGPYRLVAEAVDGDEVASLDVVVSAAAVAGANTVSTPTGAHDPAAHASMSMPGAPSDEPLALDRARSGAVTAAAILFIVVCLATGAVLLRRPRAHSLEEST